MSTPKGLLLAMMEPPPAITEEFNEWYDTEHIPQRVAVPGFITTLRFVCNEGWPRYLAVYDVESLAVLDKPEYRALTGDNFSPWSRRMLLKVSGQWRFSGPQIYPGDAVMGGVAGPASLLLLRWRDGRPEWRDLIVRGVQKSFAGRPGMLQARAFEARTSTGVDYVALVESTMPQKRDALDAEAFGDSLAGIDLVNVYSPYWRRGSAHAIYR
jgi:hypothetical protein